jgi:hypothetical protein
MTADLLRRVRWGNVARAAAVLLALALVLLWPRLRSQAAPLPPAAATPALGGRVGTTEVAPPAHAAAPAEAATRRAATRPAKKRHVARRRARAARARRAKRHRPMTPRVATPARPAPSAPGRPPAAAAPVAAPAPPPAAPGAEFRP